MTRTEALFQVRRLHALRLSFRAEIEAAEVAQAKARSKKASREAIARAETARACDAEAVAELAKIRAAFAA